MAKTNYPMTRGVRQLRANQVPFVPHLYPYAAYGGTRQAAMALGVPEHQVIKTLVLETDAGDPLLVLMHGDCEVSTKQLARALSVKAVTPCEVKKAQRLTGYSVGGISPFGTRRALPVYVESSILDMEHLYINGGKRGFLVEISPQDLQALLPIDEVEVAIAGTAKS